MIFLGINLTKDVQLIHWNCLFTEIIALSGHHSLVFFNPVEFRWIIFLRSHSHNFSVMAAYYFNVKMAFVINCSVKITQISALAVCWECKHPKAVVGKDMLSSSLTWFLVGLCPLIAVGQRLSSAVHDVATGFIRKILRDTEREKARMRWSKTEVFCILILEVTLHHFCHIVAGL